MLIAPTAAVILNRLHAFRRNATTNARTSDSQQANRLQVLLSFIFGPSKHAGGYTVLL